MKKLLQGEELKKRAIRLGIDLQGEGRANSVSGRTPTAPDYELQRRVSEVERSIRESRLWWFAIISAIASVFSAIAAVIAVTATKR